MKLIVGRKVVISYLMVLILKDLQCLLAIYWHLSCFDWQLIKSLAFSEGAELFLETKHPDCPHGDWQQVND